MKPIMKTIAWLTAFSIAMGYLESAVVVYLRMLFYPEGFHFPLKALDHSTSITEFWREAATMVMLYGVSWLAGKNRHQRFAFFLYNFAIWDLFYYVFLKVILNWPESLLTWDILFLIPVPWVGPVLVPCILSITMIVFSGIILNFNVKDPNTRMKRSEGWLIIAGSIIVIASCVEDFISNLRERKELGNMFNIFNPRGKSQLFTDFTTYMPKSFDWWLFAIGEGLILLVIVMYFVRQKSTLVPKCEK